VAYIAQSVNVLLAMILSDVPDMLLSPTYHIFNMYKVHQNSLLLPIHIETEKYVGPGDEKVQSRFDLVDSEPGIPIINATVSQDKEGLMHFTITNTHPEKSQEVNIDIRGAEAKKIVSGSGTILTAETVDAINTFDNPKQVHPASFNDARLQNGKLKIQIPAHSVLLISVE
jgi:alpha-N-arabinofuranosidase